MRNIVVFLIIATTSCNDKIESAKEIENRFSFYPKNPDSLLYDNNWEENRIKACKIFNLPSLFNGTDSFELRIWYWMAFDHHKRALVFRNDGRTWAGFNYFSYSQTLISQDGNTLFPADPKRLGSNVFLTKELNPSCGWSQFGDSLDKYEIKIIPTEGDIKNYKYRGFLDGHGYIFEIATRNSYRLLSYNIPESCEYGECKKIVAFLNFLERQFGNDYCWPYCWTVGQANPLEQSR